MDTDGKIKLELYLHVPFCVRKCFYCDFLSAPATEKDREAYVEALCNEIRYYNYLSKEYSLVSVFLGGGTPSILSMEQIRRLMTAVWETFPHEPEQQPFSKDVEVTMECNPGTLSKELLQTMKTAGINRLSIGLQSANDEELSRLGRIHTYRDFLEGYRMAREAGFSNINIDLMQALPGQTEQSFQKTLQEVMQLQPEHISVYSLIIEEGTPFYEQYHQHPDQLPDEDAERCMVNRSEQELIRAGYLHYEISNYAKPGYECRHNCGYWTGVEYLGLGLGASSYLKQRRFDNTRNLEEYIVNWIGKTGVNSIEEESQTEAKVRGAAEGIPIYCNEVRLTREARMEEFMFLGLRMTEGISTKRFADEFQASFDSVYGQVTEQLCQKGLLCSQNGRIFLTVRGREVSNRVLAEFLLSD